VLLGVGVRKWPKHWSYKMALALINQINTARHHFILLLGEGLREWRKCYRDRAASSPTIYVTSGEHRIALLGVHPRKFSKKLLGQEKLNTDKPDGYG